ncbi:MAG: PRC-barrel domain-containing protein [Acidimicrobiales bacterium]
MFPASDIREWRQHAVVDESGHSIGKLEAVYVDTATDEPAFASITIGIVGRHRLTFVPLDGATVSPSSLRVKYSKKEVKGAMTIDTDGELAAVDERALFEHYGLPYRPGATGERRLARR